jgi:SAM-dependent methyltransferase
MTQNMHTHHLAAVVITHNLPDSADARFGLRQLKSLCSPKTRWLIGMTLEQALALLPEHGADELVLWLDNAWLTPDVCCIPRLVAALQQGADVAWACDATQPVPMPAPAYATLRGMERFVAEHPVFQVSVSSQHKASLGLASRSGWGLFLSHSASAVRVAGAWAHDASTYFDNQRREVLALLPDRLHKMLDVGGGSGGFLRLVKQTQSQVVTHLVELSASAAAVARTSAGIDHVWEGPFQEWQTTDRYDCISFLDVLEHFADPEAALLHAKSLLSPTGAILMSLPNVGHWSVVADLLEGRWDWATAGIHCYTHVRFFTRQTIVDMLCRVGLQAQAWDTVQAPCPVDWRSQWLSPRLQLDESSLDSYSYLVRAIPNPTHGPEQARCP